MVAVAGFVLPMWQTWIEFVVPNFKSLAFEGIWGTY